MNLLTDKDDNLSFIRISLFFVFIGFLFLAGSALSVYLDNQTRRSPLDIPLPAGADQWGGIENNGETSRKIFYKVPGDNIDAVVEHYNQELATLYGEPVQGTLQETCTRYPATGNYPDYQENQGLVPFEHRCMFDRSGLNATQFTEVTIQPGVASSDPTQDSAGSVVIAYEQYWQS